MTDDKDLVDLFEGMHVRCAHLNKQAKSQRLSVIEGQLGKERAETLYRWRAVRNILVNYRWIIGRAQEFLQNMQQR